LDKNIIHSNDLLDAKLSLPISSTFTGTTQLFIAVEENADSPIRDNLEPLSNKHLFNDLQDPKLDGHKISTDSGITTSGSDSIYRQIDFSETWLRNPSETLYKHGPGMNEIDSIGQFANAEPSIN
jgi:hypothetical protein